MATTAVWRPAEIVTDKETNLFQVEQKENETDWIFLVEKQISTVCVLEW